MNKLFLLEKKNENISLQLTPTRRKKEKQLKL